MNTFGYHFRCTTFGESHGEAIGVVVDGCPPGIELAPGDIQPFLDRRRPGTSDLVSPRQEEDRVEILSGTFEGKTTGTPLAMLVRNMRDPAPVITISCGTCSGRAMPISRTPGNTASGTTAVAGGVRAGRPPEGLRRVRWP